MPISGTSLTEQIISSHKEVYGAGDLSFLEFAVKENLMINNDFINENVEDIKINQFEKVQNEYFQGINLFNYK